MRVDGAFDGLGLRGNDSAPVTAEGARLPARARLGADGGGFGIMMGIVLPWFNVMSAAVSVGPHGGRGRAHGEARRRHEVRARGHRRSPTCRRCARSSRACASRPIRRRRSTPIRSPRSATGRADAMLRVLESKAAAGEAATEVTDLAMRVCGGAAFRKDVGVERVFRDARAARSWRRPPTCSTTSSARPSAACRCSEETTMTKTTRARRGRVRRQGRDRSGTASGVVRRARPRVRLRPVLELRAPGRGSPARRLRRRVELAARLDRGRAARAQARPRGAGDRDARHRSRSDERRARARRQRRQDARRSARQARRRRRGRLAAGDADPAARVRRGGRRRSRSCVTMCSSASTATTSAASATRSRRCSPARSTPRA